MIKLIKNEMIKKPNSEKQFIIQALEFFARNKVVSH